MPTRLEVLLHRRKSAAAELHQRQSAANASGGIRPAAEFAENRWGRLESLDVICAKLSQFIDDFAWGGVHCQPPAQYFSRSGSFPLTRCLRCDMAKSVT